MPNRMSELNKLFYQGARELLASAARTIRRPELEGVSGERLRQSTIDAIDLLALLHARLTATG